MYIEDIFYLWMNRSIGGFAEMEITFCIFIIKR